MNGWPVIRIDLDGQYFDITQDFLDKYPESMFAKSMMVANGRETEPIEIDRDGKHFSKILEYSRGNRNAFKLSQMSHIEITKLINDLNFFGVADDLVAQCERELAFKYQRCIASVTDEEHFKDLLEGENRILIILRLGLLITTSSQDPGDYIERALKLVDRDKCLIIGYSGKIDGSNREPDGVLSKSLILYDPVVSKELLIDLNTRESSLLQMIYYANTLHEPMMLSQKFTCDPPDQADYGKNFYRFELFGDMLQNCPHICG